MAVSDRTCRWFAFSHFFLIAGSLAIVFFNSSQGTTGLGTNTGLSQAFITATNVLNSFIIILVAMELVLRGAMSAFFVYPCDFQKRSFCCYEYKMPIFWLLGLGLSIISFIVVAAISALLIIMVGLPNINIVRVAVPVGISAVQAVVSYISFRTSRTELRKEIAEEEADAAGIVLDETVVPLVEEGEQSSPREDFTKSPRDPLPTPSPYSYSPRHGSPSVRTSQNLRNSAGLRNSGGLRNSQGGRARSPYPQE